MISTWSSSLHTNSTDLHSWNQLCVCQGSDSVSRGRGKKMQAWLLSCQTWSPFSYQTWGWIPDLLDSMAGRIIPDLESGNHTTFWFHDSFLVLHERLFWSACSLRVGELTGSIGWETDGVQTQEERRSRGDHLNENGDELAHIWNDCEHDKKRKREREKPTLFNGNKLIGSRLSALINYETVKGTVLQWVRIEKEGEGEKSGPVLVSEWGAYLFPHTNLLLW